jgi:hypothetical protein
MRVSPEDNEPPNPAEPHDGPLPATLTFVLVMGVTFVVLWFGMFALLKARW